MTEAIVAWWLIVFSVALFALVWREAKREKKRQEERRAVERIVRRYKRRGHED